jgi:hypothetical protein
MRVEFRNSIASTQPAETSNLLYIALKIPNRTILHDPTLPKHKPNPVSTTIELLTMKLSGIALLATLLITVPALPLSANSQRMYTLLLTFLYILE